MEENKQDAINKILDGINDIKASSISDFKKRAIIEEAESIIKVLSKEVFTEEDKNKIRFFEKNVKLIYRSQNRGSLPIAGYPTK